MSWRRDAFGARALRPHHSAQGDSELSQKSCDCIACVSQPADCRQLTTLSCKSHAAHSVVLADCGMVALSSASEQPSTVESEQPEGGGPSMRVPLHCAALHWFSAHDIRNDSTKRPQLFVCPHATRSARQLHEWAVGLFKSTASEQLRNAA